MTALESLREKIRTARAIGEPFGMVVLTADEAQAVVDEVYKLREPVTLTDIFTDLGAPLDAEDSRSLAREVRGFVDDRPRTPDRYPLPGESDDEVI